MTENGLFPIICFCVAMITVNTKIQKYAMKKRNIFIAYFLAVDIEISLNNRYVHTKHIIMTQI